MKKIVAAKLHGIRVTDANLHYHGSITLDPDQCELAGILPMEFVDIWNKDSGARISTYVIYGERGSRACILNGAAARTCQKGDTVIICSCDYIDPARLEDVAPVVLAFDEENHVTDVMRYRVTRGADARLSFAIETERGEPLPVPLHEDDQPSRRKVDASAATVATQPDGRVPAR